MKEIKDDTNRKMNHILGLEESILLNDYTTQGNLQIQSNPCHIINSIFHRNKTKKS